MTKRAYLSISALILIALVALLVYSLDRTSWLLAQYELSQPDTLAHWLGLAPLALGVAAALVIEIGAVALVAGDVLASAHPDIKRYASAGLLVVLSVQALANLLAGFVRGYQAVLVTLVAHDADPDLAWYVAGLAWVLSSCAVPALIFILSKLTALTVRLALDMPAKTEALVDQATEQIAPPKRVPGFVYILRGEGQGFKIGCAQDVDARYRQIAGFVPFAVEVVHTIPTKDMYATETRMHRYFELAGKRGNGEWFDLSSIDLSTIKAIAEQEVDRIFERSLKLLADAGGVRDREFDAAFWLQQASAKKPLELPQPKQTPKLAVAKQYVCPHCNRPLKSKQSRAAAFSNGYCPACKAERKAA